MQSKESVKKYRGDSPFVLFIFCTPFYCLNAWNRLCAVKFYEVKKASYEVEKKYNCTKIQTCFFFLAWTLNKQNRNENTTAKK